MSVIIIGSVHPTLAQDSSNIAKQAQNPIARLISVPFENDFNPQTGIDKEDSYVLEMKPVVPFTLSKDWNLITRTIVPAIQVPDLAPGVNGTTGLGDVSLSLFLSPGKGWPYYLGRWANRVFSYCNARHPWYEETQCRPDSCCTKEPRPLAIWNAGVQLIFRGGTISAKGCQSDADAAICKLQPSSRVVPYVLTDHHRRLGKTTS